MAILRSLSILLPILFAIYSATATSESIDESFLHCISSNPQQSTPISQLILTQKSSNYSSVLNNSVRNSRFLNNLKLRPQFIITPSHESHIQVSIVCARENNMQVRVRSGGHDYEGLSYVSNVPFIIIDLFNLRSISVDLRSESAWVGAGATLGELYYKIAEKSKVYGFPAGSCSTVGVGGQISGGGFGTIFRKHGLAADNVIDVKIVDVNGRILDRESMGEDLFWAIRGGGGASFGVILSWKVRLVPVPPIVTVFGVQKSLEQGAFDLLLKWQDIGDKLHEDIFLHAIITVKASPNGHNKTILVHFESLFLGDADRLLQLMQESFPELGITRNDCKDMSWIQSVLYFAGFSTRESSNVLLDRTTQSKSFSKAKSDYVKKPIPGTGLGGLFKMLLQEETSMLILTPYGGKMNQISDSQTPFPYRNGNLYQIQYLITWDLEEESEKNLNWMRSLYAYMSPYVSKSPRSAYFNYRDLDLGRNNEKKTSYAESSAWGLKYFNKNFKRLVQVKTAVDPHNFFRNEQSIPVFPFGKKA